MLTTWMLNQPAVSGSVPADGSPLAMLSDVGQTVAGQPLTLSANGFDPAQANSSLTYAWDFGDGSRASGSNVTHTYRATGTYTLTLTATSASGSRVVKKTLRVSFSPVTYSNPYSPLRGLNTPNPGVKLPSADNTLPAPPALPAPFAQTSFSTPGASNTALATLPPILPSRPSSQPQASLPLWPLIL